MAGTTTGRGRLAARCRKHAFAPSARFRPRNGVVATTVLPGQKPCFAAIRAELASGTSVAGDDPVNASDPSGDAWCPLGHVTSDPNSGCRGDGGLSEVSNIAGGVQLAADGLAVVTSPAAEVGVPEFFAGVSEVAGAVSTAASCAQTFYGDVESCYTALTIAAGSGGLLSYGALHDAAYLVQLAIDGFSYLWGKYSKGIEGSDLLSSSCWTTSSQPA